MLSEGQQARLAKLEGKAVLEGWLWPGEETELDKLTRIAAETDDPMIVRGSKPRYSKGAEVVITTEDVIGKEDIYSDPQYKSASFGYGEDECIATNPKVRWLPQGTEAKVVDVGKATVRTRRTPTGFKSTRRYKVQTPEGSYWVCPSEIRSVSGYQRFQKDVSPAGFEVEDVPLVVRRPPASEAELTDEQASDLFRYVAGLGYEWQDYKWDRATISLEQYNRIRKLMSRAGGDDPDEDTVPLTNEMVRYLKKAGLWGESKFGLIDSRRDSAIEVDYDQGLVRRVF